MSLLKELELQFCVFGTKSALEAKKMKMVVKLNPNVAIGGLSFCSSGAHLQVA